MSMSAVSEKGKTEKKDEELKVKGSKRGRRRKREGQEGERRRGRRQG